MSEELPILKGILKGVVSYHNARRLTGETYNFHPLIDIISSSRAITESSSSVPGPEDGKYSRRRQFPASARVPSALRHLTFHWKQRSQSVCIIVIFDLDSSESLSRQQAVVVLFAG